MKRIKISKAIIINTWAVFLLLSLFFPLRKVFLTNTSYILGSYSDFTTLSIYSSDILIAIGLLLSIFYKDILKTKRLWSTYLALSLITLISFTFNKNQAQNISWFYMTLIYSAIVLHATIVSFSDILKTTLYSHIFIFLTFLESFLSILQFSLHRSIGIYTLGESHIDPFTNNVARILSEGLSFLRGYGTFPHPNVLSAFMATGVILCFFTYMNSESIKKRLVYLSLTGFIMLGLLITFSRAGILGCLVGLTIFGVYCLYNKKIKKTLFFAAYLIILSISTVFLLKNQFITRSNVFDSATQERVLYNSIGFKISKNNPFFGLGPGMSLVHMQQYSPSSLKEWEHQPIHNYFLLNMAEMGIFWLILVTFILFLPLILSIKNVKKISTWENRDLIVLLSLLTCYFTLMFFDHYFYTIEQTRLLLWIISAITIGLLGKTRINRYL